MKSIVPQHCCSFLCLLTFTDISPQHWRGFGYGVPGRDQPGVDGPLRLVKYLRVLPSTAPHIPKPNRPPQRGCGGHVSAQVSYRQPWKVSVQNVIDFCNLLLHLIDIYCRPEEYKKKVADYVRKYASEEALRNLRDPAEVSSDSESSMSDFSEDEAGVRTNKPTVYLTHNSPIFDEHQTQSP